MVRIAHFSIQEYLLSDRIKRGRVAGFAISSTIGHLQISEACLIYLYNEDFLDQALTLDCVAQYPFARFAAQFWHHHWGQPDIDMIAELEIWIQTLLLVEHNFDR
jgi:ankyrin repeat domain-containing protein 50